MHAHTHTHIHTHTHKDSTLVVSIKGDLGEAKSFLASKDKEQSGAYI